jgi:hypothetical protein
VQLQKHLKRKEYKDSAAFAADVELVFENAMTFNEDHTPIWENARILRVRLIPLAELSVSLTSIL